MRACCLGVCWHSRLQVCLLGCWFACLFVDSFVGLFNSFISLSLLFPWFCACACKCSCLVRTPPCKSRQVLEFPSHFGFYLPEMLGSPPGQRANTTDLLTAVAGCSAVSKLGVVAAKADGEASALHQKCSCAGITLMLEEDNAEAHSES